MATLDNNRALQYRNYVHVVNSTSGSRRASHTGESESLASNATIRNIDSENSPNHFCYSFRIQ